MLNLDYRDARPIYEQVKDGLRRLMVTGVIQEGEKLQGAFWYRSLSFGQIMRVRRDRMLLYGALLIGGYGVLFVNSVS